MFRKIVSNLAFSPALVGQLSFYAKRLQKEELTRRFGLIFTALALLVQSFTIFAPPEPANAASSSDFVNGGVSSLSEYLKYYDQNSKNIKDIYDAIGITRAELQSAKATTINSKNGIFSWGMTSHFSAAQGEKPYTYAKSDGSTGSVYSRPLNLWDSTSYTLKYGSTYDAYVGNSATLGWFAIIKTCGNLATKIVPAPAAAIPRPVINPLAPAAVVCTGLTYGISNRNLVQLNGSAQPSGGATISAYNYTIKDRFGFTVTKQSVSTTTTSSSLNTVSLSPGTYTATLSVSTSQGEITSDANCVKKITIQAPAMCQYNPSITAESIECQPCPGDTSIWIKDSKCTASTIQTKTAKNLTQAGADATTVIAQSSDRIAYTVSISNTGKAPTDVSIDENLGDVLEYAALFDSGGGTLSDSTKVLSWPKQTLAPGTQVSRVFVVELMKSIPSTPQGISNKTSYDCVMTNSFGNSVSINVACPVIKKVENAVAQLPTTGPTENVLFAGALLSIVTYFYTRARLIKKEIRIIRHDLNTGSLQ